MKMSDLEAFNQLNLAGASAGSTTESAQSSQQQQSTKPIDVLDNYPIFNNLCSHLDIAGILPLQRVTRRWSRHISAHLKERWNINKKLRRFVTNPQNLRTELGRYDALISGSFAIQFFDGVIWEESDLDIYVKRLEGDAPIGKYLMSKEGYKFETVKSLKDHDGYPSVKDLISVSLPVCHFPERN